MTPRSEDQKHSEEPKHLGITLDFELILNSIYLIYASFPLDGADLVAVRELIHQEVPKCVNKESSTERRS